MELNKTFIDGLWSKEINVTSFVQTNITPYAQSPGIVAVKAIARHYPR